MNCPNCLSVMRHIGAINPIPNQPGRERMDLHCSNRGSYYQIDPTKCLARCHMGVITEDPKEWICHEYSFQMRLDDKNYYLHGHDYLVDPKHQKHSRDEFSRFTSLSNGKDNLIFKVDFIPLSTGNDMHLQAWDLLYRLRKLAIFS
jgi:hypothetical protein